MKNVLIFMLKFSAGGAERQLVKTALLLKRTYNVSFMVFSDEGYFQKILSEEGFSIEVIKRCGVWKTSRKLRRYVKENNIDAVLSYLPECNIINELASLPFKSWKVITGARNADPKFVQNRKLRLYYHAHLLSDAIISNSESNKTDILKVNKFLPEHRIHVLYNMIEPIFVAGEYIPFRNSKINIVVAANYRKQKNILCLLKALTLLTKEEQSKFHFDWFGLEIDESKSLAQKFIEDNSLNDIITLHPSTDKVMEHYYKADVVGLFSHYEGLPNSLCEALVLGKTVITTPVSDMPKILDGTENIVCSSDNAEEICNGLRSLYSIKDKIVEIGFANRTKYSKIFEPQIFINQLQDIIEN